MKNSKKFLSMALAAALFVSFAVSGCGKKADDTASASASSGTASSGTPASTTPAGPDTSEFKALSMILVGDKSADHDMVYAEINKKLKQDVNASVDVTFLPWSDWGTKYPLMFASGEEFDMIYTSNWAFYAQQVTKGGFMELTDDMLQTYAPKIWENVTPDQWTQTKVNGKKYMIPQTSEVYSKRIFLVRGDLMKKYGISEIKTREDMIKYWDAVLANEKGMLPFGIGGGNGGEQGWWVIEAFTNNPNVGQNYFGQFYQTYDLTDPANINTIDTSKYDFEDYKRMAEFKSKGYWSKNAMTQADDSMTMFKNGKSATAQRELDNINWLYMQTMKEHPEWEPQIADIVPEKPAMLNPAINNGMGIHATSENAERSLMVLNLFSYDRDYYDLTSSGIKGVHWESVGDNMIKSLKSSYGGQFGWPTTLARESEEAAPNKKTLTDGFRQNKMCPALSLFNFDSSNVKTEYAACTSVSAKYAPILQMGFSEDVEGLYAKWHDELKKSGVEKLQSEYMKQAQEFMKNYK